MKPLYLTMEAFGPYEKETCIDFTQFGNALFLITGRTGSGKTTIFDGIMYALYGVVSGGERKPNEMRTKNAHPKTKTRVELLFEHRENQYRVERLIPANDKNPQAVLEFPDGTVVEGVKNVTAALIDLLGIDAEQFRGIVMLAQGKFRELLTATSEKRADILRKIFNTQIYEIFQKKLKEKTKEAETSYKHAVATIQSMISNLSCPEEKTELAAYLENPIINSPSISKLFDAIFQLDVEDKKQMGELKEKIAKLDEEGRKVNGELANANKTNGQLESLKSAQEKLQQLEKEGAYYKKLEGDIKYTRKAETVLGVEKLYKKAQEGVKSFRETIEEKNRIITENNPEVEKYASMVETLQKDSRNEAWKKEKVELEHVLPKYEELESAQNTLKSTKKEKIESETKKEKIERTIAACNDELQKIESTLKTLETVQVDLEKAITSRNEVRQKFFNAGELEEHIQNLHSLQEKHLLSIREYESARKEYEEKCAKALSMEKMLWDGQAGVLAEDLEEGIACPVCGSLTHPHPAVKLTSVPTKEDVDKANKDKDIANKKSEGASVKSAQDKTAFETKYESVRKTAEKDFGENISIPDNLFDLSPILTELKTKTAKEEANLSSIITSLSEKVNLRNSLIEYKPNMEEKKNRADIELQEISAVLQGIDNKVHSFTGMISTLQKDLKYSSKKDVEEKISQLDKQIKGLEKELGDAQKEHLRLKGLVDQASGALKEAERKLTVAIKEEKEVREKFGTSLSDAGFRSEEEYKDALLGLSSLEEDERKFQKYIQEVAKEKGTVAALEKETKGLVYIDTTQLKAKEDEILISLENLRNISNELNRRCVENAKHIKKIKEEWISSEEMMKKNAALSELSEIANGEVNGSKLDLERYVMAAFFDDVLATANQKLIGMTNGRYQLQRSDESKRANSKCGLDLEVIDRYTMDSTRGTQTLSGGESFMAALSLALGLSEVIQHTTSGIAIDALFVDEGFDSLDTDTLQEVLKVLQGLTTGNRLVGIISHVESLKEQMDKKIVVTKLGDGKSSVDIEC